MRAPILNDRGQFRYSDFVAYIPEYLKAEPDVVTLLQVFSDYINNAYRNVDTVEKFEFAVVSRADTIGRVKAKMEYLRMMLDLAGSRHDFVNLLSVPRANIKSNRVFGQSTGYTPLVVPYSAQSVMDEIPDASSLVPGITEFDDGDVIFVSYDLIDGLNKEVAYYYASDRNSLIREPMGTSQDPFTGSYNTSSRIITFHISDVSSVNERYGYTSENGTQYKEVFFTARIFDVQSSPATKKFTLNGGTQALIDYYGTERNSNDAIRSVMRFYDESGWNWANGFPTAMIYLSETSGANLASTGSGDNKHLPLGLCADPSITGECMKYPVKSLTVTNNGTVVATLDSFFPVYSNGTVRLAIKNSMELIGTFTVAHDTRESGAYDVILIPVGTMPLINENEEYVIVDVPLFYDRGMLDYGKASPIINLNHFYPVDVVSDGSAIIENSMIPGKDITVYACSDSRHNEVVGTLNIYSRTDTDRPANAAYLKGSNTVVVPYNSDLVKNFGTKFDIGSELYIRGECMYWEGIAVVGKVEIVDEGYAITLTGDNIRMMPARIQVDVLVNEAGYIALETDPDTGTQKLAWMSNVAFPKDDGLFVFERLDSVDDNNKFIRRVSTMTRVTDLGLADGHYAISMLEQTNAFVRNLLSVNIVDGHVVTIWDKSRGDMFTCHYVMVKDSLGNMSICETWNEPGKEVRPITNDTEYHVGEYVYSNVTGHVYLCVEDCFVTDDTTAISGNSFDEDRIVHYSVPYAGKINAFTPFYGQIAAKEYGSSIDYRVDPEVFLSPLYITKVEEKTLKYGWEHREFLNYGDVMNLSGRARNGMVEFHTTERTNNADIESMTVDSQMDIVNTDLFNRATWSYSHPVVTHGCTDYVTVDIDDAEYLVVNRVDATTWRVTVHSADHGLVDGSMIKVEGIPDAPVRGGVLNLNVTGARINAVDGDVFTYDILGDADLAGKNCYAPYAGGSIQYIQDHNVVVSEINGSDGFVHVKFTDMVYGLHAGDFVYLEGCVLDGSAYPSGPYEVSTVDDNLYGIYLNLPHGDIPEPTRFSIVRKPISDGDIVMITDAYGAPLKFYEVNSGAWNEVERNGLLTPLTLFAQNNLFDVTETNPLVAFGDPIVINDIIYTGNGRATVHVDTALPHFVSENRKYIEGKTVVYISNVTPSDFCGFHVVEHINSPTSFEIAMRLYNKPANSVDTYRGIPTSDLVMTMRECRWYKYDIEEIEWDKCSSVATFTGNNVTTPSSKHNLQCDSAHGLSLHENIILEEPGNEGGNATVASGTVVGVPGSHAVEIRLTAGKYVENMKIRGVRTRKRAASVSTTEDPVTELVCEHAHGLAVGDYVVLGTDFSRFDESTGLDGYAMGQVIAVSGETIVTVSIIYGSYSSGMSIARGIITLPGMDNLTRRHDEYSIRIGSLLGLQADSGINDSDKNYVNYTFRDGDIVLAAGQIIPSERVAYLVRSGAQWSVLKKKRIMKIRKVTVDEYHNPGYLDAAAEDGQDEYKYTTYSDVDVAKSAGWAYASRMNMVRNPVFNKPAIDNIDTTREMNAEYSSGEDFGNVAPRDDMKPSFAGVPDMKYPLIEKIERLAYLRDASVIDFDLIGYLARFMGYDITPMAEDIENSNLYRTMKEKENAIREAVMNLPQYYALGGTNAGLRMIMGAFGVIGDVLTLYTNTMHPYGEMLNKDEVEARLASDTENGTLSGTWVSTPYIDIELTDDSRYPQFAIQPGDISRIKEQIRLWKPINVVFRDILLRYVAELDMKASITGPFVGIGEFGTAIGLGDPDSESDTVIDPDYIDPELTNCAF